MTIPVLSNLRSDIPDGTLSAIGAVGDVFDNYVVFPSPEARDAVVLWTLHTHVFKSFDTTPRLSIRSKEPGSGKSRVLEVLEHLVPQPLMAVHLTPGVLWRKLEHGSPTILFDEADTVFGKVGSSSSHRQLRGILNAGYRKGATVPRCVGAEDVKEFHVFGPIAMAGLGRLPETVASRSVEIVMRKRKPDDPPVRQFRLRFALEQLQHAYSQCETWASRAAKPLKVALPDLPVINRDADVWEPLVAIADLAGPEWAERARKACKALTATKEPSIGPALLADIRMVFEDDRALPTAELLARLQQLPGSPWRYATFTGRAMARLLAEYGIASQTIRHDGEVVRGYKRMAFTEAWGRYADGD